VHFSSHQESQKSELPAASIKLIHSGKVLKDEDIISTCGIKESDFLVVMVTKPKKVQAPPDSGAATASASTATTPKANEETKSSEVATSAAAPAATPAPNTTTIPPTPAAPARTDNFSDDAVNNLTAMGFPEAEVRHCLRAANGNPDVAVEFLTNGIPDGVAAASGTGLAHTPSANSGTPLQSLRNHPQFDALRRVVQSNPAMLQQVLTQIGQQQPELLEEINANQAIFLHMMNEPVTDSSTTSTTGVTQQSPTTSNNSSRSGGFPAGGIEGMGNPAQMAQMIQSMSPEELSQMASMMGLPPEQLRQTAQMIGQMPPEQLNQFMMQAMGGTDGLMGEGGAGLGGQHVLRLTEEEMAAVDRLAELGFDRSEAAQAFLACDKNEALAANLLMDSMGDSGFGGGFSGANNDDNDGGDDEGDDQMYD
jgi:UV excision repair protein RAD23